jgi:acetyl/propionyl-CoA carboxylase alpha subunit
VILGPTTNLRFLRDVFNHPEFREGRTTTAFIEHHFANWQSPDKVVPDEALIAAALCEMLAAQTTRPAGEFTSEGDMFSPWSRVDRFRLGEIG